MAMNSELLSQLFSQWLGVGPEDTLKKYTSKSFLLQDQDRMLNHIKQQMEQYPYCTNLSLQNNFGLKTAMKVNLLSSNRVNISALTKSIDTCIKGKFLLCRVISLPLKMSAVVVVVDDPEGDLAVRFSMYNFFPPSNKKKLSHFLPIGTIMAVKNPLFKTSGDGGYGLRSDNPGDVTFLNESQCEQLLPNVTWKSKIPKKFRAAFEQAKPKTADDWKTLGNKHFAEKNYIAAINAYTSGLKIDPQLVSILSNRTAAYLQTSAFDLALADANEVLKIEPSHAKAIYRKGKALCGLKSYKEAWEFLAHISGVDLKENDRDEMIKLKKNIKLFIRQQETGDYDIAFMLKTAMGNSRCRFDFADYSGPVEVHEAPGKGRGVFATQDIEPGQLLIASKAFATHFSVIHMDADNMNINCDVNLGTRKVDLTVGNQESMESYIARMLSINPDKGKEFYKLYAGPELRFLDHKLGDDMSLVDQKRIKLICDLNSFEPYDDTRDATSGIWLLPSFINHSCFDCNCIWMVCGDFLLIRAFKAIPKGEEVLISYIRPYQTYSQRLELFEKHRFLCDCTLCVVDQKDSEKVHQKRRRLLEDFALLSVGDLSCDSSIYKYYVNRLGSLRSANPDLNIYIIPPLITLAVSLAKNEGQPMKAAEVMEKVYNISKGTMLCDVTLSVTFSIITYNLMVNQKDRAMKWLDTLREYILLVYGTTSVLDVFSLGHELFPLVLMLKEHGLQL